MSRASARIQAGLYRLAASLVLVYHRLALPFLTEAGRTRYGERLGRWPGTERVPEVWVHAASVGEVGVASLLIGGLRRRRPGLRILLTCNTATGRQAAAAAGADEVRYLPLDHPRVLGRLLQSARPELFLFVETEIWPLLLTELGRRGIPRVMVNARISELSYPRYRRVRAMLSEVLGDIEGFCVRDQESGRRLQRLGAPGQRMRVTGDLKFDGLDAADTADLLGPISGGDAVVVAASTRPGEDEQLLEAFVRLRGQGLRLVLAPRHPERSREVAELAAARGLDVSMWTALAEAERSQVWEVLVVDTVGQLRGFMRAARGVFVGGSLVPVGGHNLLEPALYGVPVAAGPNLDNVREQADVLLGKEALALVDGPEALAELWAGWLADPVAARAMGGRAREVVESGRGALARTLAVVEPYLPA